MPTKNEDIDAGADERNERDNRQAMNDFAEVDPGGTLREANAESEKGQGDRDDRRD